MTWRIALLIAVQAAGWICMLVLSMSWAFRQGDEPEPARHLHVVQSDAASSVRALRDAGPYDWAADEPAGGAA